MAASANGAWVVSKLANILQKQPRYNLKSSSVPTDSAIASCLLNRLAIAVRLALQTLKLTLRINPFIH